MRLWPFNRQETGSIQGTDLAERLATLESVVRNLQEERARSELDLNLLYEKATAAVSRLNTRAARELAREPAATPEAAAPPLPTPVSPGNYTTAQVLQMVRQRRGA